MVERIQSAEITIMVDTNKRTTQETFRTFDDMVHFLIHHGLCGAFDVPEEIVALPRYCDGAEDK